MSVVTIGNFDGVHVGHQAIMRLTMDKARAHGASGSANSSKKSTSIALTFRPHPQIALRPEVDVPLITTYDEKLELIAALGIDRVVEQPFSREFSTTSPEQFFNEILLRSLSAEVIVVGYDFAFGKGRQGSLEAMEGFCKKAGVELVVVPAMRVDVEGSSEIVSSSRIRNHLGQGDVSGAKTLLGRPFFYRGVVIKGEGRGRKIGFPTANLQFDKKLLLPNGVYSTESWSGGRKYSSVTNIGVRPTFHTEAVGPSIETHLIDATIDLYGGPLEVRFLKKLRDEKKFESVEKLTQQIARDVQSAREAR